MMEIAYRMKYGKEYSTASRFEQVLWADAWNAALASIYNHCKLIKYIGD
jgi:hypothetical protein